MEIIPHEGIYYVVRYSTGWRLEALPLDAEDNSNHAEWWENSLSDLLATEWASCLGKGCSGIKDEIAQACYGFPRGRVSRVQRGRFLVNYGKNIEPFMSVSKSQIEKAIGIAGCCSWRFDDHEQCIMEDKELIRECLQIKENWKAV